MCVERNYCLIVFVRNKYTDCAIIEHCLESHLMQRHLEKNVYSLSIYMCVHTFSVTLKYRNYKT